MNRLVLIEPELSFGENHHPVCIAGFEIISKRITCMLDTGFSLGFAFSNSSIPKFNFKDGYLVSMLLGNGRVTKGTVFIVDLFGRLADKKEVFYGKTSAVFMQRSGSPLIGVEAMQLWSPISLDWESSLVSGNT